MELDPLAEPAQDLVTWVTVDVPVLRGVSLAIDRGEMVGY